MGPFNVMEVANKGKVLDKLWIRGGFPDSFLARNDSDSLKFRKNFIRTYLERDVPQFGPRIPAKTLERLWTMLAHGQGTLLNASRLASSLAVSTPTVTSYYRPSGRSAAVAAPAAVACEHRQASGIRVAFYLTSQ